MFNQVKNEIASERVLAHFDSNKPLVLATDASSYGIGAVLWHTFEDGTEKPNAFVSRTLKEAEKDTHKWTKKHYPFIGVARHFSITYMGTSSLS